MNTQFLPVAACTLMMSVTAPATAQSIHISDNQMDSVTAGSDVANINQVYSSARAVQADNGLTHLRIVAFAQGDIVQTDAIVQTPLESPMSFGSIPFSSFIVTP